MTIFSLVSVYAYEDPSKNCDNTSTFIERSGRVGGISTCILCCDFKCSLNEYDNGRLFLFKFQKCESSI